MVYSPAVEAWLKKTQGDLTLTRARGAIIQSTAAYSWAEVTEDRLTQLLQEFQSCWGRISTVTVKGKTTSRQSSETLIGKFSKATGRPTLAAMSEHGATVALLRKTGYRPALSPVESAIATIEESLKALDK